MRICFHLLELVDGLFFVSFFIDQFYSQYISFNVILVFPLFLTFLVKFIIILRNWIWNYVKRPTSRMEYVHRWLCRWLASFHFFFCHECWHQNLCFQNRFSRVYCFIVFIILLWSFFKKYHCVSFRSNWFHWVLLSITFKKIIIRTYVSDMT